MALDTTGIVIIAVVGGLLLLGGISKAVHGNGENTQKASYDGGRTRRNRNRGSRRR